ncbi:MAG: EpsG family protein [Clostridia bacterium]|nr:EpsG family protein [Clostridia bacterium]
MFPYYLLIFVPLFFSVVRFKTKSKIVYNRLPLIMFFIFFIILLSLRSVNCGVDLMNYQNKFDNISYSSLKSFFDFSSVEQGYKFLSAISKIIVNDFQFFLFLCAIVSVVPIMLLYINETKHNLLTISLFVGVAPFTIFFSGLRQSIAIGIGIICYYFCKKNKIILFLLFVALAFSFHQSSIVLLLLYPLTHVKFTKKWIAPILILFVVFMVYNKQIFSVLMGLNDRYESLYTISDTGSYTYLILIFIFVIYSFVIPDENDGDLIGLRNLLVLMLFIQSFAPINTVVMRLNYYFLILIPIIIPKIIDNSKPQYRQVANISSIVFTCFFIFWFFKEAYTGSNILHAFPYIPFWED